jgi:hypothetical protein
MMEKRRGVIALVSVHLVHVNHTRYVQLILVLVKLVGVATKNEIIKKAGQPVPPYTYKPTPNPLPYYCSLLSRERGTN